ncbi:Pleckstrin homology and RUN domain containing M1 [Carabus blaptoides fortunei]
MAAPIPVTNPIAVNYAAELITYGEVIAVPTDTVYGLACSATDAKAVHKLYSIKGRSENKPLSICLSRLDNVNRWARVDHLPNGLLSALLPGPVTVVLHYTSKLEQSLTSSDGKVGIRIPDNAFIRSVVNKLDYPIALTSANVSGNPSSISTVEFESLWPQLACVFDQGKVGSDTNREASTVVDISYPGFYKLLRSGIAAEQTKFILHSHGLENRHHKDNIIKNAITTQLSQSVKEIQLCGMNENLSGDSMNLTDAANSLCSIIEAMFLHGAKDSLAHRARRVISNDVDQRPEPSFWSALLIFSHRQIIDQISSLPNITTEIGQCRAWIRFALNDLLLSSYFMTIRQNCDALKLFYKSQAYIRDPDLLEVAQKLIEGIETCTVFSLPYNSTLLNSWPLPTLMLAGIWSPTLRHCPIASGVDVAQSLSNSESSVSNSNTRSIDSDMSLTSQSSEMRKILALNEDEALKIILSNTSIDNYSVARDMTSATRSEESRHLPAEDSDASRLQEPPGLGNSLNRKSGWSFDETQNENVNVNSVATTPTTTTTTTEINRSVSIEGARSMEHSYHALIESYNMMSGSYVKTPNLRDVWQHFEDKSVSSLESCEPEIHKDQSEEVTNPEDQLNFEFVNASTLKTSEIRFFLLQIGKLPQEKGLDTQNYECFACKHPLSVTVCKPRICGYTGHCYCDSCISPEPVVIPSRIVHNWDFKQYHVSKKAATFLSDVKNHPLLNMKTINPYIYSGVEELARLQNVRVQLNFLRDYLYTCREPVIEQLQRLVWPKDYMYEHIHQYSISDLTQIPGGVLADNLQTVVNFGREHVMGCWLCSQKGFVCEVCTKAKVLYPFDVESTYRCEICNAVYHIECLNPSKLCPKCERRRKREHLSLLDATLE